MKKQTKLSLALLVVLLIATMICATGCGKTFKVSFDMNGGTPAIAEQEVEKGGTATIPAAPEKENADFVGWYLGEKEYSFDTPVTADITLKAQWNQHIFVTFTIDGQEYKKLEIVDGKIEKPEDPTPPADSDFAGWFTEDGKPFDFDKAPDEDVSIVAQWTKHIYATFIADGKTYKKVQIIDGKVSKPADPEAPAGKKFAGWVDANGKTFDFSAKLTEDTKITAKFEDLPVVATTDIKLNKTVLEFEQGKTAQITATVLPEDATDKTVTFKSDDTSIATVDANGLVKGVNPGSCKVTVSQGKISKTVEVNVNGYQNLWILLDDDDAPTYEHGTYYNSGNPVKIEVAGNLTYVNPKFVHGSEIDLSKLKMVGGDKYIKYENGYIYATAESASLTETKVETVSFEYTDPNGFKQKTDHTYAIVVEPKLNASTFDNCTYDSVSNTFVIDSLSKPFKIKFNCAISGRPSQQYIKGFHYDYNDAKKGGAVAEITVTDVVDEYNWAYITFNTRAGQTITLEFKL